MGLAYKKNTVVNNALVMQPEISHSLIVLLENSFYGSSRVLLRQFFEYLIIGKFSEFDNGSIIQKWENKTETGREFDISLTNDILNKIKNNRDVSQIESTWRILSTLSHPTKYAQQIPTYLSSEDWMNNVNFSNTHYTLDLFFMLLCMNYHLLISNWGKKSRGWYFGYHRDPMNSWVRENFLKDKIKITIKEYFEYNKRYKKINKDLKKTIFQYRQNWS